jgi:phosphoglycolate phosphatase
VTESLPHPRNGGRNDRRLILFDVDGTLIERGDPAHLAAIDAGIGAAFPDLRASIRDIDFDGKIDRQIVREVLRMAGVLEVVDDTTLSTILAAATEAYRASWQGRAGDDDLLPGVRNLIQRLAVDGRFTLGLLTGGIRGVVETKMKRLALEPYFPVGAFGDEVEQRSELLPLALARAEERYGERFERDQVVVVGDTPNDIAAAHAGEVACLGVATGRFTLEELRAAGADRVLPNLTDTEEVVATLLSITRACDELRATERPGGAAG